MEMADDHMKVMSMLPLVEVGVLEDVAAELQLPVPENSQGNRLLVFRQIMTYLNSDQLEELEDHGVGRLANLVARLEEVLGDKDDKSIKSEVSETAKIGEKEPEKTDIVQTLKLHRLSEFKIKGSIGDPNQEGKLDFRNLSYQIQSGKERGYSDKEICSAVVSAITPGNTLRSYLEGVDGLDLKFIIKILRSHYKVKDATSIFTQMSNQFQGEESELAFCMNLMKLRKLTKLMKLM